MWTWRQTVWMTWFYWLFVDAVIIDWRSKEVSNQKPANAVCSKTALMYYKTLDCSSIEEESATVGLSIDFHYPMHTLETHHWIIQEGFPTLRKKLVILLPQIIVLLVASWWSHVTDLWAGSAETKMNNIGVGVSLIKSLVKNTFHCLLCWQCTSLFLLVKWSWMSWPRAKMTLLITND